MILNRSRMRKSKLAFLTMFALPLPVIAALVSIHCHGAALTNELRNTANDSDQPIDVRSNAAIDGGQTITSFIVSPAALVGGKPATARIDLRYPAPEGGLLITLKNTASNGASIPTHVVVPQGKTSVHFAVTTKPVKSLLSIDLSATCQTATTTNTLSLLPPERVRWYVAPGGSRQGQGTQTLPWDLGTALSNPAVKPGDTIWLRAGTYTGTFVSTLNGRPDAPIIVRAVPGERVIIDKALADDAKQPALKVKGSWVWFWGMEVMNSNVDRHRNSPYSGADEPWRGSGADVYAPNVKFINMIFHDNGHGIWDKQDMTEVHGCLFFYNGNNKREHAMYIGNASGTKYITDNIVFDQGGYGILAYSNSAKSSQKGLHLEGNIAFNNGILTNDDQKTGNLQVGGVSGVSAEQIVLKNNYIYNTAGNAASKNNGIRLGYEDTANKDVKLFDNYVVSKVPLLLWWWQSVDFRGNSIYANGDSIELKMPAGVKASSYRWDFNSYFFAPGESLFTNELGGYSFSRWRQTTGLDRHSQAKEARPGGVDIFVRPNRYEAGRANIVVYNWQLKDQVAVDLSSLFPVGTNFEIRDAQNYFGTPVVRGSYSGGSVFLPMRLSAMTSPVGQVERVPRHTAPEFAVFVVQPVLSNRSL